MAIRSLFFIALTLCMAAAAQQLGNQPTTSTDVLGVLTLPDGSKFRTTLYNMRVIGQLRTTKKLPYFILAGTTCTECDENTSIYIHSPSDGPMKNEAEQRRFPYPGRETDYETGTLRAGNKGRLGRGCTRGVVVDSQRRSTLRLIHQSLPSASH